MSDATVRIVEPQGSLRDIYYVLFARKWQFLLVFVLTWAAVIVLTLLAPKVYKSEAKLLVKPGRESLAMDPTIPEGRVLSVNRSMHEQLNTELEILNSRNLLERVVIQLSPDYINADPEDLSEGPGRKAARGVLRRFGLFKDLSLKDRAMQKLASGLDVGVLKETNVLRVALETPDPKLSETALVTLIGEYLDARLTVYQVSGSHDFFREQVQSTKLELEAVDEQLRMLKNEIGVVDLVAHRAAMVHRLGSLEQERDGVEARLAASHAAVQSLDEDLAQMPQTTTLEQTVGRPNHFMDNARVRLLDLRLRERELSAKYPEDSRFVTEIHEQIEAAEKLLAGETNTLTERKVGVNRSHEELSIAFQQERRNATALEEQRRVLAGQLEAAGDTLRQLNDDEAKLVRLEREQATLERKYRDYAEKLEVTRISRALEQEKISNVAIMQPPTSPVLPDRPKTALNLAIGLLLALAGGLGWCFVGACFDHSIRTPECVERRLQLPTLASLPRLCGRRSLVARKPELLVKLGESRRLKWAGRHNGSMGLVRHFEALRHDLLQSSNGFVGMPRVFGVAGFHHGEGVTTIAANLAVTLLRHGEGPVLLVDANLETPLLHHVFDVPQAPGIAGLLEEAEAEDLANPVVFRVGAQLDLLPAGVTTGSLSDIFSAPKFKTLLEGLKERYKLIVIDIPALQPAPCAFHLCRLCDRVLLVIEAERERWEVADSMKRRLVAARVPIAGVVLNKRRFPVPQWLYRTL